MKKLIFVFTLFAGLFVTAATASAGIPVVYSYGPETEVVAQLPDSVMVDGEHVNLGVMYDRFSIFWIPMWNYGETKYVLLNNKKDTYWDLSAENMAFIRAEFNVAVPEEPRIGFWNRTGGKLIWGIIILAAVYGFRSNRKDDSEAETAEKTPPAQEA